MNRGNNKKPSSNFDEWVDRINRKLSRLLGKKNDNKLPRNKTSALTFSFIILTSVLVIWCATGFYYLQDNQYGVIVRMGKLSYVVKGIKVGLTLPYPFEQIVVFNGGANNTVKIGDVTADDAKFVVLSKELEPVTISARFTYQITNPEDLYTNYLQEDNDLGEVISWHLKSQIHEYISEKTIVDLKNSNSIVIANELRNLVNDDIESYGIKITKLNIESLYQVNVSPILETQKVAHANPIATELIKEAKLYYQEQIEIAKNNVDTINQLIPAYEQNPDGVATELYYEALKQIPVNKNNNYPLLDLSLSELLIKINVLESKSEDNSYTEDFREVRRERNFERGR